MRRSLIRFTSAALLCLLVLVGRAPAQISVRQVICPADPIPTGWLKVDVISSPATCGGDAWVIEIFTNKAPGSAMVVCADQPTPGGWRTIGVATSTGQCAGGSVPASNIKAILRVG